MTGNIIIGWNHPSGEAYGIPHEGSMKVESQSGIIEVEEPMDSMGIRVQPPITAKREVNRDNWNEDAAGRGIESWGYDDALTKYRIQMPAPGRMIRLR
jgi:hypothetical protein